MKIKFLTIKCMQINQAVDVGSVKLRGMFYFIVNINHVISVLICSSVSMVIMALEKGHKDFFYIVEKIENMVFVQGGCVFVF